MVLKVGDVIAGKYRVEQKLGSGGIGVVVAARHLELGTQVALKILLPEARTDPAQLERFAREARAMVRLTSPHCARVFDVGKLDDGSPYMVMELLVGEDLSAVLDRVGSPLPVGAVVDVVLQVALGVAEAHSIGIVHRDLKPSNIFLAKHPDGTETVKVLDFGLAKSVDTPEGHDKQLTRTSNVLGSPPYMSPEQLRAATDIDVRTDVWSLGICLYELLTGKLPFDSPSIPELCSLVLTATPLPPSEHQPGLPPDIVATVMKCLEKEPAQRFRDMGELAAALAPHARSAGESVRRIRHLLDVPASSRRLDAPISAARLPALADKRTVITSEGRVDRRSISMLAVVVAALIVGIAVVVGALLVVRTRPRPVVTQVPIPAVSAAPEPVPVVTAAPSASPLVAAPPPSASPVVRAAVPAHRTAPPPAARPITTSF